MTEITKRKNNSSPRKCSVFLTWWILGHALAWIPFFIAPDLMFSSFNNIGFSIFTGLTIGSIASITQYWGLRQQFGKTLKQWIPVSILTWILSALVVYQGNFASLDLRLIGLYLPVAIVQAVMLRQHVKHAWLWVFASFAGAAMDAMFDPILGSNMWSAVFGFGLYGALTGSILLWLFGMAQPAEKQKDISVLRERLSDGDQVLDTHVLDRQRSEKKQEYL